jgi:hypothetical protein
MGHNPIKDAFNIHGVYNVEIPVLGLSTHKAQLA